jgi:hypothetical protein
MICISSSLLLSTACVLYGIFLKTSCRFFSRLSVHCFSFCVFILTYSSTSCSASFSSLAISMSIASTLARDCISCATPICNPYSAFLSIFTNTNSTCATSLSGVYASSSSSCSIIVVRWKVGLPYTKICIVSSTPHGVLSLSFVDHCVGTCL